MKPRIPFLVLLTLAACTTRTDEPQSEARADLGRVVDPQSRPHSKVPVTKPARDAQRATLTRTVTCVDGESERTLWVSEDLIAEFAPSGAGRSALHASDPGASEVAQSQRGVRLWRVAAQQGAEAFVASLQAAPGLGDLPLSFSPVLHDTSSPASAMSALPGGVVATFPKDWDRARIDRWLRARGLSAESEVGEGLNTFLIPTQAGLVALETSNELARTGELVACSPNWWQQAAAR